MRKQKGFSLIELLIVVAIILIIAAIAIPNLMQSKRAANESAGAANMRTIISSEHTFNSLYFPTTGYFADTLGRLGTPAGGCVAPHPDQTNACLLDVNLGCAAAPCTKDAYQYTVTAVGAYPTVTDYVAFATPAGPTFAQKDYCVTSNGVVNLAPDATPPGAVVTTPLPCGTAPFAPL